VTADQAARLDVLRGVLSVYPALRDYNPDVGELVALSEWVNDGSISAATAIVGQTAALYRPDRQDRP
jgi:hypothetical protein